MYYLLHGNGETQNGWMFSGRANIILDNLIADGKAVPMIVVMPHGHAILRAPMVGRLPGRCSSPEATGMYEFHRLLPTI